MSSILPVSEMLESRTLLSSAFINNTVLTIIGDLKTANNISVHRTGDNEITVSMNGKDQVFGPCDPITKVVIEGGNKPDKLVINESDRPLDLPVLMNGKIGDDTVEGGAGNDSIWGNAGHDNVAGQNGNDVLYGGSGEDAMFGGNGNDTFHGGDPHDRMDGGAGKNRFLKH